MKNYGDVAAIGSASILLLAMTSAYAEESPSSRGERIAVGGSVGVSLATQSTPRPFGTNVDAGNKAGLAFGASATVSMYRAPAATTGFFLDVQPEILYVAKGTNLDVDGETLGAYHLSYIEIPLLVRAGFRSTRNLAPYLLLGPELGVLLTAELENSRGEFSDTTDGFTITDFGLVVGVGAALDIASINGSLHFEARYDLGLTDINDRGTDGYVKNRAMFVMLGYRYRAW